MNDALRLENLLHAHRIDQCVLFVGAGFSLGAERAADGGQSVPLESASGLISFMNDALGEHSDDLGALSDTYEEEYGEHGLFELLNKLFVARSVTDTQTKIVNFGWKEIYTTNYDNVLQLCFNALGKRYSTFSTSQRPSEIDYRTLPLIHINGQVAGANFRSFRKEIKLTTTQYFSDDFSRSPWGERFRNDVITSPCIVFAGYSLYD